MSDAHQCSLVPPMLQARLPPNCSDAALYAEAVYGVVSGGRDDKGYSGVRKGIQWCKEGNTVSSGEEKGMQCCVVKVKGDEEKDRGIGCIGYRGQRERLV